MPQVIKQPEVMDKVSDKAYDTMKKETERQIKLFLDGKIS